MTGYGQRNKIECENSTEKIKTIIITTQLEKVIPITIGILSQQRKTKLKL